MTLCPREHLASQLLAAVQGDDFWEDYLDCMASQECLPFSVHLAVTREPFLELMLEGRKTVESRFSMNRCAPYGRVEHGDVVLLKETGGPIVGLCHVSRTWFYSLDPRSREAIRERFASTMCAESASFWTERKDKLFATLMRISRVRMINPIRFQKQDRRGWVILMESSKQLGLPPLEL